MSLLSKFAKFLPFERNALDIYKSEIDEINSLKDTIAQLSQDAIVEEISGYKAELAKLTDNNEIQKRLISIRSRVFALTRESAKRAIGQFHYDVQLVGGLALSEGKIAEMRTGEGKTLTATLPLVLYALAGKGAHLVTVNDYLSRWQASLMGPVFHFMGLSVASIQHEQSFLYDPTYKPEAEEIAQLEGQTQGFVMDVLHMRPVSRRQSYSSDITYGTNNEFGFDYLRDNMVQSQTQQVQRDLFFAIVDEVDSILIDEARTPLIISAPDTEPTSKYLEFARLVDGLKSGLHYSVDEKHKSATLTDEGVNKVEEILNVPNIYDTSKGVATLHHIEQSLRAKTLFLLDRDYVIRDGEIVIVDEFTGRLMFGRRYSEGLHQAIEAKEGVKIQQESKTLATITFQNLFRLYFKLAGMTGTAKTEEEEFFKIYQLQVLQIPTNRSLQRQDLPDVIYKTEDAKFKAIAKEVKKRHKTGQPVLIGTVSIAKNEKLAGYLKVEGVPFEMLNAKNHEREAQVIAQAGRLGAVTLATNIAGRGVDILLGGNPVDHEEAEQVRVAGGLHVLGTERHESRRIDNQLRGRSGRQGDPGSSQFFVSMEDDLMRLFGGEKMKSMMNTLGIADDEPIEAKLVSRSIEQAQKKIEGMNFDTRKHVLEFDDVLNRQRNIIYQRRRRYLHINSEKTEATQTKDQSLSPEILAIKTEILDLIQKELTDMVMFKFQSPASTDEILKDIFESANNILPVTDAVVAKVKSAQENAADREFAVTDELFKAAKDYFEFKEKEISQSLYLQICGYLILQAIDTNWMEHLDSMDHLRDSVRLRGYGQRDPLVEYKKEGYKMFQRMIESVNKQVVYSALKVTVHSESAPVQEVKSENLTTQAKSPLDLPQGHNTKRNDPCPCGSGRKYKKCHGA